MKIFRYVLAVLCLTLMSSHARSQTFTAYDLTTAAAGNSYVGNLSYASTAGMEFDVNAQSIQITSLGVFDSGADGFHHVLTTYLFNRDTHDLIASQSFSGSTDATAGVLQGYHRFLPVLGQLVLNPGHYIIASSGFLTDGAGSDPLGAETLAGYVPDTFNSGGGLISAVSPSVYAEAQLGGGAYPNSTFGDALAYNTGTFQFTLDVPEPGSVAMLLGLSGLGASVAFRKVRRRQAKK
ncbi:MAG: hypothetical protein JWL77_6142 [Chthonomonadaceae bacterium]|nr:hypothetical protein [Chthonomonadaceae bacterium]